MLPTNAKDISTTFRLIGAALAGGLLKKEEVIDWADKVVTATANPDIFFIELAMSSKKSAKEILQQVNSYDDRYKPAVKPRPLLGLSYKRYKEGVFTPGETIAKLYQLKDQLAFLPIEDMHIYSLDDAFSNARDKYHGDMEDVQFELDRFLGLYKAYSFDNIEQWPALDKMVDAAL